MPAALLSSCGIKVGLCYDFQCFQMCHACLLCVALQEQVCCQSAHIPTKILSVAHQNCHWCQCAQTATISHTSTGLDTNIAAKPPLGQPKMYISQDTWYLIHGVEQIKKRRWGRRSVTTKKNVVVFKPNALKPTTPSPKDKLKIKTKAKAKDDAWYDNAYKRFSISRNRVDTRKDYLASLRSPIKSEL